MEENKMVMALGFFDGVHLGHKKLIEKTIEIAFQTGYAAGLMTFSDHPLTKIFPRYAPLIITDNPEKEKIIHEAGIEHVYFEDFDEKLMQLSPENFVKEYLVDKYHVGHVVVGYNYSFGYQGAGKIEDLKYFAEKYHFDVTIVPPFVLDGIVVSSTLIREQIKNGKVALAEKYLGRSYSISGKVVHGKALGHLYGVPTANILPEKNRQMPAPGVYFTHVTINGEEYDGLTNVGCNPTFEDHPFSIETFIYRYSGDLYNYDIDVAFCVRQRGEVKFEGIEALFERIKKDIVLADQKYRIKHEPFVDAM